MSAGANTFTINKIMHMGHTYMTTEIYNGEWKKMTHTMSLTSFKVLNTDRERMGG